MVKGESGGDSGGGGQKRQADALLLHASQALGTSPITFDHFLATNITDISARSRAITSRAQKTFTFSTWRQKLCDLFPALTSSVPGAFPHGLLQTLNHQFIVTLQLLLPTSTPTTWIPIRHHLHLQEQSESVQPRSNSMPSALVELQAFTTAGMIVWNRSKVTRTRHVSRSRCLPTVS